ncbi:MAG: DNA repair protein RecN [Christensenellaceae bacterium]|jgi:DNA repair protein RecN (Recombination protein N)
MIQELYIENIALIDQLRVTFEAGFNVLSGETGAGKSIIVDSVNLILGSRADKELIRTGETSAYVEVLLFLSQEEQENPVFLEHGVKSGETLILSRELQESGRSVCRINNRAVSLQVLRSVAAMFIDMYGQNQNQKLLDERYHLRLIDTMGGARVATAKTQVAEGYTQYGKIKKELETLEGSAAEKARTLDLLNYQIEEITAANLSMGEEERLQEEKTLLLHAEQIMSSFSGAKEALNGENGALPQVFSAVRALEQIKDMSAAYEKIYTTLQDAYYALEDAGYEVAGQAENIVFDEQARNEIEERLVLIGSLKRKYGENIQTILSYLEECEAQKEMLEHSEIRLEALQQQVLQEETRLKKASETLSRLREETARQFETRLKEELVDLGMQDAIIETKFTRGNYTKEGWDEVSFFISINKGMQPRSLARIASGGEISRIMLAIKNIMAQQDDVGTLIFDEIDTGISGTMAQMVARKIANIARERQVICVTHLPQIAAMGDANYYIEKREEKNKTTTSLEKIADVRLEEEVARLSGGLHTEVAMEHSRELLENAANYKKGLG